MSKITEYLRPVEKKNALSGLSQEAIDAIIQGRELYRSGKLDVPMRELHRRAVKLFGLKCGIDCFRSFMKEEHEQVQLPPPPRKSHQGRKSI